MYATKSPMKTMRLSNSNKLFSVSYSNFYSLLFLRFQGVVMLEINIAFIYTFKQSVEYLQGIKYGNQDIWAILKAFRIQH